MLNPKLHMPYPKLYTRSTNFALPSPMPVIPSFEFAGELLGGSHFTADAAHRGQIHNCLNWRKRV